MVEVYRAHNTTLDRQVDIKVLPDIFGGEFSGEPEWLTPRSLFGTRSKLIVRVSEEPRM